MKSAVIVFPGSNCDRDVAVALTAATGHAPAMVWHDDAELPPVDLIVLPGGFSYGDYLRCGAVAARARVMTAVRAASGRGVAVLGICNGFQVLCEAGLLPGALMRNAGLNFICRDVTLRVEATRSPLLSGLEAGSVVSFPIAHHEGNFQADPETLARLEGEGRVAFRYADADGAAADGANPNGAARNIAGILNAPGRVLGLMPHPERVMDPLHGGTDGARFFAGLATALAA
jgi:phosphoribosylformylglycinamidine synthase subunit PurQ / glutaminase